MPQGSPKQTLADFRYRWTSDLGMAASIYRTSGRECLSPLCKEHLSISFAAIFIFLSTPLYHLTAAHTCLRSLMDPAERVPTTLPQSEIPSPVHASGEDTSRTIQVDPFTPSYFNVPRTITRIDNSNLSPFVGNLSSPTSEKSAVNETPPPNGPTNNVDDLTHPIQPPLPVRISHPGRRKTRTNSDNRFLNGRRLIDDNGISWIVPTDERVSEVSKVFIILDLNCANFICF